MMTLLALTLAAPAAAAPFTATEMMKLKRLADPQLSPDGKWVAYQAQEIDLPAGTRNTDLWIVPFEGGDAPRRLTHHPKADTRPRWSPDGKRIAFLSNRDGETQAFILDLAGGEARKVTSLSTEAGGVLWVDDRTFLVTSDVHPSCGADDACNKQKLEAAGKPSPARVYDHLLFRHWDTWEDGRRTHLLLAPVNGGPARDLTPGDRDTPPFSLGNEDYAVSPDGTEVAFSRNDDPVEALSTNAELYVVPVAGGSPVKIAGSPGYDGSPRYSPDGTKIAFRAQMRAGYESDRWRLMVYDRQSRTTRNLTEPFAWTGPASRRSRGSTTPSSRPSTSVPERA